MAYDLDLAERIRELVASEDGIDERRMFGGLAFLVNGNMSVAVSPRGGLLARVGTDDAPDLVDARVQPAVMGGRQMRGWLRVEASAVEHDDQLTSWVRRCVDHARTLPAK